MVISELPPPYLPSLGWYREFAVGSVSEHFRINNAVIADRSGRRFSLTVPVQGGRNALRRSAHESLISMHGGWQTVHLHAIKSAYGQYPYFSHIYPLIESLYPDSPVSLGKFTTTLHEELCRLFFSHGALRQAVEMREKTPERYRCVHVASGGCQDPSLSILHWLFGFGLATIFAVVPPLE